MNYKKIIKSRAMRKQILRIFRFIPDKTMIKIQYRIKTGRKLNLKNPQRYTEKLQWYKLNYMNPIMVACVDKYDVRAFVEDRGVAECLNQCYGVYDNPQDIDFDRLPKQFVLKDTLGGGGNDVIICKDIAELNINEVMEKMQKWVNTPVVKGGGREWPYYNGKKHRIIIDQYLECSDEDLPDYKFFCFDGVCHYSYVKVEYAKSHDDGKLAFFDKNKKQLEAKFDYCLKADYSMKLPDNYDKMLEYAETLSQGFPHVRVDFFNVDGRIVFGEMTFFNASGYMNFEPDSFDFEMGSVFRLRKN